MRQEKRCKLQPVGLLLICILLSAWSLVYKCFADADGIVTGSLDTPVYAQFCIYKDSNRNKALSLVRECIRIQAKVKNRKTEAMKTEAMKTEARKYIDRNARFQRAIRCKEMYVP